MAAPDLLAILLFCLAVPCVYRWLMPGLAPSAKAVASIFLLALVIALLMSLATAQSKGIEFWLWDLEQEWNISTALASTQLALVGFIALLTAWLAKREPAPARLLYAVYGMLFLLLAGDEYFKLHERHAGLQGLYAIGGLALALAALPVARRASTQSRLWQALLLAGLAISALGGLAIDNIYAAACGGIGILHLFDQCLDLHWLEECLEFLGVWLALVAMLGALSATLNAAKARAGWALLLLPALWLILLWQSNAIPPIGEHAYLESAAVDFGGGARLRAYSIEELKGDVHAYLYLSLGSNNLTEHGYSIVIVDQASLALVARGDQRAHTWNKFVMAPAYVPTYRYLYTLPFPQDIRRNRAYWILLSLWREVDGQFQNLSIASSDLPTLGDAVILQEFVLQSQPPPDPAPPLASFDNGLAVMATTLPPCARLGETLAIDFGWRAEQAGAEDLVQFLHFFAADGSFWNHDQWPLGARLPTRLWYRGLTDRETWRVAPPAELPEGDYALFIGLYNARTMQRVPARDPAGIAYPDARVPLGNLALKQAC